MILNFCIDAFMYLAKDSENVIAIHCKAGKGRSGLMACCFLLFIGACDGFEAIIKLYGSRRTNDQEGLTISSQIRYLSYFERMLRINKIHPFPRFVLDYLQYGSEVVEHHSNHTRRSLRFINLGPVKTNANIKIWVIF